MLGSSPLLLVVVHLAPRPRLLPVSIGCSNNRWVDRPRRGRDNNGSFRSGGALRPAAVGAGDEVHVGVGTWGRPQRGRSTNRLSPRRMRRASGHGDKEGTGGKAFVSIGDGGKEVFGDEACVGARDKD